MRKSIISLFGLIALILLSYFLWSALKFKPDQWKVELMDLGSSSSPQAVDLNGDGIKDIILGAGASEFNKTDRAIMALDGKDGTLLWKVGGRNQVVGSPTLMDINGDGIPEIFIGGRSAL